MPAGKLDRYSNIMAVTVQQAVANTITFNEIRVGLNLFDKVGILINRIDYAFSGAAVSELAAAGDAVQLGLCQSNGLVALSVEQQEIIDFVGYYTAAPAAAADIQIFPTYIQRDYSTLPGGGILTTPKPLFAVFDSAGCANPHYGTLKIYFTIVNLKPDEYFELLEARQFFA
jgi:hypothetical protein